jgi:Fe-S-cluster containining protein
MTARALRMAYRDIPTMTCKAGCSDCCGIAPFTKVEFDRVADLLPADSAVTPVPGGFGVTKVTAPSRCAFVTEAGCSIYDKRPAVCRLFGTLPEDPRMRCPHGCKPARPLTRAKAAGIMTRVMAADRE